MQKINLKNILSNLFNIVTIIVTIALASMLFGENNTLIWVAVEVAVLMFMKIGIEIELKQATCIVVLLFWLIGLSNRIAMINPYIGIVVNFITIFILTYVPSRKVSEKAYMPFVLCYIFGQSMATSSENFTSRIVSLIVGSIIVAAFYYFYNRKSVKSKIEISNIDIMSDRFILAIKMSLGVTIAMYIGSMFNLQKTLWIALSTMSITQIEFKHTKEKFKHRIKSTFIGAIAFVILFQLIIPDRYATFATLVLSYIYTFVQVYSIQIIFITVNALSSAMILFDGVTAIWLRIILVVTGCIIGYLINRIDFKKIFEFFKERKNIVVENN